jgi:hypothetical protein
MSNSLFFKIKDNVNIDKHRLLELFFKDWVDDSCNNEVHYLIQRDIIKDWEPGMVHYRETFRVDFDTQEDALAMRLRGVPQEFQSYLEMVKQVP